ncbi:MAG: hypothetical protein JNK00_08510 [Flavipsychrobacter sp.]|nr:hypothetical protein [Flavipsychrobacter sp.]
MNGKVVANTTSRNTIRAVAEGDAKNQCVYFETEEDYATQQAVVQHYCEIR